VAANDDDPDGNLDPSSANSSCANGSVGCNGAANGSLTDNGDGTVTYTPTPDYNGGDSFVYEICDTLGACDTATVNLTISAVNDPPLAVDDSANTTQDTAVIINVTANDSDIDGNLNPSSANSSCAHGSSGCNGAANGTLTDNGDGTITYTPNPGFSGGDSFVYEVCDSGTPSLCDTATVNLTVIPSTPETLEVRVAASTDDAEENDSGSVDLSSSDLEMVYYEVGNQTVGMRFPNVVIPQGATIVNAYVQFQVDETGLDPVSLTIAGEAVSNTLSFENVSGNISAWTRTAASVAWSPAPWLVVGEAGPDQQTPDIASVIQEIVSLPGWSSGNALALIITGDGAGTGNRVAESYDGVPAGAPLLHVEYSTGG
jgi:hypothetical protein